MKVQDKSLFDYAIHFAIDSPKDEVWMAHKVLRANGRTRAHDISIITFALEHRAHDLL